MSKKYKLGSSLWKVLLIIYPPYILLLVLTPLCVGLFINHQLVDIRSLGISLIWIPLLSIPYYLSGNRVFYYLLVALSFIDGFLNLGHWLIIKSPISASSLFVLFNTNFEESLGFLHLKNGFEYVLLIPYIVILVFAIRYPKKVNTIKIKYAHYALILIGVISVVFIAENAFKNRLVRKGTPVLFQASISFYNEVNAYKELKNTASLKKLQLKVTPLATDKPQTFVLILGESTNRNHMSLYGFSKQTTPKLQKRDDIIVYDNVVSAYSHTLDAVLSSMSQSNLDNKLAFSESINLIDVFGSAGFKTYWISNQSPVGIWENLITLLAQQSDATKFVNVSSNSSFESTYKTSYDSKLFQPLEQALNEEGQNKFIVLHLMGCHSAYSKRYPAEFEKFKDNSSKQHQVRSSYANAVLYNDYIVDSLLSIIRIHSVHKESISAAVYMSDHGENVYDEYDYAGHDYAENMSKHNVEIPFLIWLSPDYMQTLKVESRAIALNKHKPFVTDDLFHSVIDLFALQTTLLEKNRSVFNISFDDKRKRILEDGKDYDLK
jgi:heptose-I-phosphate ethanolaminephosphotransferase